MLAIGSLVGLVPAMSSNVPATDAGAGAGFDGLVTDGAATDVANMEWPAQIAVAEEASLADDMVAAEEVAGPEATPPAPDPAGDPLPVALPVPVTAIPPPPAIDATMAAEGGMDPIASRGAWPAAPAVGSVEDAPVLQSPSGQAKDLIDAPAMPSSANAGPAQGPSDAGRARGEIGTGRTEGLSVGMNAHDHLARTHDVAPADVATPPKPAAEGGSDPLPQSGRMQVSAAGDVTSAEAGRVAAAQVPADLRKLARSSRLSINRAAPQSDVAMADTAKGGTGTADAGHPAGQPAPDARHRTDALAVRQSVQPDAGPGDPAADVHAVRADAGEAIEAPPPQSTDRPAPTAPSFEALLSKASEAAPPPRSPLVQAAVERLAPLPATPGETVLRLNPHGLGLIEVVIHEGRNGALDVALRVQNPLVLDAMRQEREAVAVVFSASQGGAEGSLSMDLMQSGTRQGGGGEDTRRQPQQTGQMAQDSRTDDAPDAPVHQLLSGDRVNIVT